MRLFRAHQRWKKLPQTSAGFGSEPEKKMHSTGFALKAGTSIYWDSTFLEVVSHRGKNFLVAFVFPCDEWRRPCNLCMPFVQVTLLGEKKKKKREGARLSFPGNYQPWRDEEQKFHHCNSRDKCLAPLQSQTTVCDDVEEKSLSALSIFPIRKGCARGSYQSDSHKYSAPSASCIQKWVHLWGCQLQHISLD